MKGLAVGLCVGCCSALVSACGGEDAGVAPPTEPPEVGPTLLSSLPPVTDPSLVAPNVFMQAFTDCRPAARSSASAGIAAGDQVCTPASISGCTAPGLYFPEQTSCDVVRTQRPYWPAPPAQMPNPSDPRLDDPTFAAELKWVTEQTAASGCTCCHDSRQAPKGTSQWYIDGPGVWTDTVSDSGIALFTGFADSSVLGAWDPKDNNGFQRTFTGIPSTDGDRMRAFFVTELTRRGITKEQAEMTPPFGGYLVTSLRKKPEACTNGEGVDAENRVKWPAEIKARYVYVLANGSKNPGVPPSGDRPEGALWRLDVLSTAEALGPGLRYGTTPTGSGQAIPSSGRAPSLQAGTTYQLFVLRDVGVVATNCSFTYPVP